MPPHSYRERRKEGATHIPVRRLGRHAHGVKARGAEPRGLGVQRVDEAVDAGVGGGRGPRESREGAGVGVGEEEALGGGEDGGGGGRDAVVAGQVVAEVAGGGVIAARGVGVELGGLASLGAEWDELGKTEAGGVRGR